jgi:hypothetical protein
MTLLPAPADLCFSDCKDIKINLFANQHDDFIANKVWIKIFMAGKREIHIVYICHISLPG